MDSLLVEVSCLIALKGDKMRPSGVDKQTFKLDLLRQPRPFIIKGSDSTPTNSPDSLTAPIRDSPTTNSSSAASNDDILSFDFSLSMFRKEVMKKGLTLLPRNHKGKIATASKTHCNQHCSMHCWKPIENTEEFHRIICEEHANGKSRIVGASLKLRVAMGYAATNTISDENNQCFVGTDCLLYSSQPELAMSPEPILSSSEIKAKNWDVKVKVENLLNRMHTEEDSPLYLGFLKAHKICFAMAMSLLIKSGADKNEENKAFHLALNSDNILLNEAETEQCMLKPYNQRGNFNSTFGCKPEKGFYPPSNITDNSPPDFNDWHNGLHGPKKGGVASTNSNPSNNQNVAIRNDTGGASTDLVSILGQLVNNKNRPLDNNDDCNATSSISTPVTNSTKHRTATFSCKWDPFPEAIVIDGDLLANESTMEDILTYCGTRGKSFSDDNKLELNNYNKNLYFQVKAENGYDDIILKKSSFLEMSIEDTDSLDHVNTQLRITIINRNDKQLIRMG